jgi:hypothetical protein
MVSSVRVHVYILLFCSSTSLRSNCWKLIPVRYNKFSLHMMQSTKSTQMHHRYRLFNNENTISALFSLPKVWSAPPVNALYCCKGSLLLLSEAA